MEKGGPTSKVAAPECKDRAKNGPKNSRGTKRPKKKMLVRPGDFDGRCGLEVGSGSALGTIEGGGEEAARHEGGGDELQRRNLKDKKEATAQ